MPCFICSTCGIVDNTALTNYWEDMVLDKPLLCSQCDPRIGRWHGKFARQTWAEMGYPREGMVGPLPPPDPPNQATQPQAGQGKSVAS